MITSLLSVVLMTYVSVIIFGLISGDVDRPRKP